MTAVSDRWQQVNRSQAETEHRSIRMLLAQIIHDGVMDLKQSDSRDELELTCGFLLGDRCQRFCDALGLDPSAFRDGVTKILEDKGYQLTTMIGDIVNDT